MFLRKKNLIIFLTLILNFLPLISLKAYSNTITAEPMFSNPTQDSAEMQKIDNQPAKEESAPAAQPDFKATINNQEKINTKYRNFTAREYFLGPNDVISIAITGIPELAQSGLKVNPEGKVNIMFANNLFVTGLTLKQLSETIAEKYKEYVINPEVIVNIEQNRPFIVYVSGAVKNPGSYELNTIPNTSPYITKPEAFIERKTPLLSNIMVAAGGVSYDADLEHIKVVNDLNNSTTEVNLLSLISDSDFAQDLFLMSGDKVIVPRLPSPMAVKEENYRLLVKSTLFQKNIPVRVIGYVNKPGLVSLASDESANINSAIAAAGGYITNYGSYPEKVYISRLNQNQQLETKTVNPLKDDIAVMPNDVIYIPEKTIPLIGKFFDYAARLINPFGTFSNTYQSWENMLK